MSGQGLDLLQDESKGLGKWFASRIDARWQLRENINETNERLKMIKAMKYAPEKLNHEVIQAACHRLTDIVMQCFAEPTRDNAQEVEVQLGYIDGMVEDMFEKD